MTRDELFAAIAGHRSALVDQLESLSDEQWNAPSLCGGWKVRDVVGHLVSLMDVPTWRYVVGTTGMSGFHRKVDRFAREFGARSKPDLVARYRELVPNRRAPVGVGPMAPLMDVIVHSLDIERALGLPTVHMALTVQAVLDAMCRGFPVMTPKSRTNGLRLEATDLDWASGSGRLVRGTSGDLALAITGRHHATIELRGDGVPVLRSRSA